MTPLTAADPQTRSADLVAENVSKLRRLLPEASTDGKIDFEVLKQLLGGAVDDRDEKYGLNWHGKRRARQLALTPSAGTLRPVPGDGVDEATTQNVVIEGDNLEVLKLLQKSYSGRVKLIYIDPPYNTGKDFVYPDDFHDNVKNYLQLTGQVEGGAKITSNPESSGRFHTDWLNMMLPRLSLARNLLSRDGVIFISIGDEELDNLLALAKHVFGEENFCGLFVWEKKKKPSFLDGNMGNVTDYVVCFAKSRPESPPFTDGTVEDGKKYPFNNAGNSLATLTFPERSVTFLCDDGAIEPCDMSEGNIVTRLLDRVEIVDGRNASAFRLEGEWRYSQAKLDEFVRAGDVITISKPPFRPNYVNRAGTSKKAANLLSHRIGGIPTNEDATEENRRLMGGDVFDHPKPVGLLRFLIRAVTEPDDLIVDFFAGSGTLGHAAMVQNAEDGGRRRFLLVQLPEPLDPNNGNQATAAAFCDRLGRPRTISELTKERLRRAAGAVRTENSLFTGDVGFRVFKLDSSNIRAWDAQPTDLDRQLFDLAEHLKPDRSEADILTELLLKLGIDLCAPIDTRTIQGKTVYEIGAGVLIVCLDASIGRQDAEPLALGIVAWRNEMRPAGASLVVFRDHGFVDDVAKVNLSAILAQHGVSDVRSI